jgi:hypothetical protein
MADYEDTAGSTFDQGSATIGGATKASQYNLHKRNDAYIRTLSSRALGGHETPSGFTFPPIVTYNESGHSFHCWLPLQHGHAICDNYVIVDPADYGGAFNDTSDSALLNRAIFVQAYSYNLQDDHQFANEECWPGGAGEEWLSSANTVKHAEYQGFVNGMGWSSGAFGRAINGAISLDLTTGGALRIGIADVNSANPDYMYYLIINFSPRWKIA